ncbi:MAG: ArsS family sensor histidine kinase [Sulfurimonas sp.]|uniref:ArsS family sensor histidine kinase n=1 Tax=Sulfurimonas sp. TaxID=2022749 RepID=UPI002616C61E|nr:ArsS family sensor histidine kinase [Sulfurimonas sp.]MCW8894515.1 ArsS family sensor histidine kinase [Sulfurimonas sp.]MCW8955161.1 ArsS family sensor histidine kinase [Sulfurimonas sp.]MCW9067776.1 ArsS family sensor histidine kinase [Sulfurimonas sp.]
MSIFNKIIILFVISFASMIFVANETKKLTIDTIETALIEKYIHVSDDLFVYFSDNDIKKLEKKITALHLKIIEDEKHYIEKSDVVYEYSNKLSSIKILKHEDDRYILYMKYLDDEIFLIDKQQSINFEEREFLKYMVIINIFIVIALFIILLKMTYPLKDISKTIKKFGNGQYCARIKTKCKAEIGEVANTFNSMAENIEGLIVSRQRLLRDIGHELKTPIAKSKIAIEMIEDSKYKKILNKALSQIDDMTSELLYIEKLNAQQSKLNIGTFNTETLISESLSKLFIEDETKVEVIIESNFSIKADINYLSIALKNLIDNALKYGTQLPIYIVAKAKSISVKSKGKELEKPLEFFCEAFTQGDNSRNQSGYGLGLSLVKRIIIKHNFELSYEYENGFNVFIITTR